jgi:Icc-related predicted phosphoesterase
MPRIVCMSDTHDRLAEYPFPIPEGDIFIHAGDFTVSGMGAEIQRFNEFLGALPHSHKVVIAGNHDLMFEGPENARARKLLTNAQYLQDSAITIEGLKIYGSPWQPEFFNWAFNLPRGYPLEKKWRSIPDNTDILITHGPPHGILDLIPSGEHVGCEDLEERIGNLSLKLHIFGHVHHSYGIKEKAWWQEEEGPHTIFVNAAICDEAYRATRQPIVIDI